MEFPARFLFSLLCLTGGLTNAQSEASLWEALQERGDIKEERGFSTRIEVEDSGTVLELRSEELGRHSYRWVTIVEKERTWDFSSVASVESEISNLGPKPVEVMFWLVGRRGWSGVVGVEKIEPGETKILSCDLRETFPDGTPKVNPEEIAKMQIMTRGKDPDIHLRVKEPVPVGRVAELWSPPEGRLEVPEMMDSEPAPGKRVRYQIPGELSPEVYGALYLPRDWTPEGSYPVIVEYPGNIFLNAKCYSTGRPGQCVIGYGMSKGEGAIWVSLPFVDRAVEGVIENGFGNAEDTVAHCLATVRDLIDRFGGDRENLFLTGFSRGSIACGYIGLRNDEIAGFWKGIHGCQHYDGSPWRESNMEDAIVRARRFRGLAIYQTDNSESRYRPVQEATAPGVNWTWDSSGLGFHDTAMFLDNRPSTVRLRTWFRDLITDSK